MEIWGNVTSGLIYRSRDNYHPAVVPPSGYFCYGDPFNYYCNDCYVDTTRTLTFSNVNFSTACSNHPDYSRTIQVTSVDFPSVVDVKWNKAGLIGWSALSGSISYDVYTYSNPPRCVPSALVGSVTNSTFTYNLRKHTTLIDVWEVYVLITSPTSAYNNEVILKNPYDNWYAPSGGYCNFNHPTSAFPNNCNAFTSGFIQVTLS